MRRVRAIRHSSSTVRVLAAAAFTAVVLSWVVAPGAASASDASHGCVRVPLDVADGLFDRIAIGTWVDIHD